MISKHVKPYIGTIILVIALIMVQAVSELSLPEYMSKIVDVGIAQSGVEYAAPVAIGKENMEALFEQGDIIYSYYHISVLEGIEMELGLPAIAEKQLFILGDHSDSNLAVVQEHFLKAFGEENQKEAISYIINEYKEIGMDIGSMQVGYILKNGGIMLAIALFSACAAVLASFGSTKVAAGFARDLRKTVFSKVIGFSNTEFDKFSTASLITRSTNDIQQLQMFMGIGMRIVVFAPAMGIGAILKVIGSQSDFTWILGISIGVIVTMVVVLFAMTGKQFKRIQELTDAANRTVREALSGMMVIRAFSNQKRSEKRFDEVNEDLSRTNRFVTRTMGAMAPVMSLVMNLAVVAILYYGAAYVESGSMQIGAVVAFIQYSRHVVMSFMMISMISIFIPRAMVSIARVQEVLRCESSINNPENPVTKDNETKGIVEFKNVSFSYQKADEYVLNNISFTANPGEITAIIGTTGSGKSTVINLIPRLYDVSEGQVMVDGVDVRQMELSHLRKKISYVPQKGILFSGSIESNIKFSGGGEIDNAAMEKAAEIAQANEFIMEREGGFESAIAQGGTNVSGGQRQRLAIARALAKPAEIIIFDDSFSALDYKTDANLRRALNTEFRDRTIIIVAQRISTIRSAGKILVMDEGTIIAEGSHDELMADCEVYRQIASSQIGEGGGN